MVSMKNIRTFFKKWKTNFSDRITKLLNSTSIILTILAFFGVSVSGYNILSWLLIGIILLIILIILWKSKPNLHFFPSNFTSQRIDFQVLSEFIVEIPILGLFGKNSTGKTTFINTLVARHEARERTYTPYVQITAIPDTSPVRYVAVLDLVGQSDYGQYLMQPNCNWAFIFIDHSESDRDGAPMEDRLKVQEYFVNQLVEAKKKEDANPQKVAIVLNKSDLWGNNEKTARAIRQFGNHLLNIVKSSQKYPEVILISSFSNRRPNDTARLFNRLTK